MGRILALKGVLNAKKRGFDCRFCPYGGVYLCAEVHPTVYPTVHPTPFSKRNVHIFAPCSTPLFWPLEASRRLRHLTANLTPCLYPHYSRIIRTDERASCAAPILRRPNYTMSSKAVNACISRPLLLCRRWCSYTAKAATQPAKTGHAATQN